MLGLGLYCVNEVTNQILFCNAISVVGAFSVLASLGIRKLPMTLVGVWAVVRYFESIVFQWHFCVSFDVFISCQEHVLFKQENLAAPAHWGGRICRGAHKAGITSHDPLSTLLVAWALKEVQSL